MTRAAEPVAPSPTASLWIGFGAMCAGMFMAVLDVQIVATSLPTIQRALAIEPDQMSWIQTAYLIAEVIAIPLTGFLTRVLGVRRLFVGSLTIFTLASAGCAASSGFSGLIAWRVLQGWSGGTLIPAVFSAVFLLFPAPRQGVATTLAGVLAVLAPTIGPIVGGWITQSQSWHWLFLINLAPGVIAAIGGFLMLPRETARWSEARKIDGVSLALLAATLCALQIGLKEAPQRGWTDGLTIGLLVLSVASGAAFAHRTLAQAVPLVDLACLADRRFAFGCLFSFVLGVGLFGSVYLMPVFLAFVRGHNAFEIGSIMLVTGLTQLLVAPIAVALEQRIDARLLTAVGFGLFAIGLAMSAFQTPRSDFAAMLAPQIVRGAAIMFCLLPPTRLALGHLEPSRIPDASGLFNLMRNLGGAIGIALIDTVIYGRAPSIGETLKAGLLAGDFEASRFVGLPDALFRMQLGAEHTPRSVAMMRPMVEKAAMTQAINEAWAMAALVTAIALVCLLFVGRSKSRRINDRVEACWVGVSDGAGLLSADPGSARFPDQAPGHFSAMAAALPGLLAAHHGLN